MYQTSSMWRLKKKKGLTASFSVPFIKILTCLLAFLKLYFSKWNTRTPGTCGDSKDCPNYYVVKFFPSYHSLTYDNIYDTFNYKNTLVPVHSQIYKTVETTF